MGLFDSIRRVVGGGESGGDDVQQDDPPDLIDTRDLDAASLREQAADVAGEVDQLDFSLESLEQFDAAIEAGYDDVLHTADDPKTYDRDVVRFGSYLGEVLIRVYGSEWTYDDGWGVTLSGPDDTVTVSVFEVADRSIRTEPVFAAVTDRAAAAVGLDDVDVDELTPNRETDDDAEVADEPDDEETTAEDAEVSDDQADDTETDEEPVTAEATADEAAIDDTAANGVDGVTSDETVAEPAVDDTATADATTEDLPDSDDTVATASEDTASGFEFGSGETIATEPADEDESSVAESDDHTSDDDTAVGGPTEDGEVDSPADDGVIDSPADDTTSASDVTGSRQGRPGSAGPVSQSSEADDAAPADTDDSDLIGERDPADDETTVDGTGGDESGADAEVGGSVGVGAAESDEADEPAQTRPSETGSASAESEYTNPFEAATTPAEDDDGDDTPAEPTVEADAVDDSPVEADEDSQADTVGDSPAEPNDEPSAVVDEAEPDHEEPATADTEATTGDDSLFADDSDESPPATTTEAGAGESSDDEPVDDASGPHDPVDSDAGADSAPDDTSAADESADPPADPTPDPTEGDDLRAEYAEEAEGFVSFWNEHDLDYTPASLARLDGLVSAEWDDHRFDDATFGSEETFDDRAFTSVTTELGSYFGEVLVRDLDAEWSDETANDSVIVEGPDGPLAIPVFRVAGTSLKQQPVFARSYESLLSDINADD